MFINGEEMKFYTYLLMLFSIIILSCDNPEEPDTTPPSVTITQPSDGATLNALTTIRANAIDDEGVKNVVFYIDGVSAYTDTESP